MLFNSLEFAAFLPIAFLIHWFACGKSARAQNACLLALSAFFYAWWDWRFLFLLAFAGLCTWASGLALARSRERERSDTPPPVCRLDSSAARTSSC